MTPEEEFDALYKKEQGLAAKQDKTTESYDSLRDAYFDAKNKGGKAFYDFIQQHKNDLMGLFDNNQQEKNLIVLVPSIGDEAIGSSDKAWVKEQNAALKKESTLRDAKIAAKEQSIKDVRQRYRPDLAKIEADDSALTERIRAELKQKGYNPTDEDVLKVKTEMLKEQERVRRADAYEQKPAWQRVAYSLAFPRSAESRAMGKEPTFKDTALDFAELGSTFLPFGAIAKFPRLFNKIGKAATKLDELTQGIPVLGIAGDLAKGGGQIAVPEFLASLGIGSADAIAYDDGRERGEKGVLGIAGDASKDAVAAALLGHAARRLSPEDQKIIDAGDAAIKKHAVSDLPPLQKGAKGDDVTIKVDDPKIQKYRLYKKFEEAGKMDNIAGYGDIKKAPIKSYFSKKQLKDYMDATGLDYIDAIDKLRHGSKEQVAGYKNLKTDVDDFYNKAVDPKLKKAAFIGPALAALLRGFGNTYGHMTEDRGYEEGEE